MRNRARLVRFSRVVNSLIIRILCRCWLVSDWGDHEEDCRSHSALCLARHPGASITSEFYLGLARCLIGLGDQATAIESLHKARAIFTKLQARPLLDEVDRHLDRATALSS